MARIAEPWKWEARKGFYAWVNGKRCRLCAISEGVRVAKNRLRDLQDEYGRDKGEVPTVGKLALDYLKALRARRDADEVNHQTKSDAERRLAGFGELYATLPCDQLKPYHVDAWLATKPEWGKTSRHDGVGAIKSAFRWAVQTGILAVNPIAEIKKPKRKLRREEIPTPEEIAKAFATKMTQELRDLLMFLHETGARPSEARTTEARHVDWANEIIVLSEHKTARKTSRKRVILLQGHAVEIVRRLCDAHPTGPIFMNTHGRPWTKDHLVHQVAALRKRAGVGAAFTAYSLRHFYITDAAAIGVTAPVLAEIAGHADTRMIATYSHISDRQEALKKAAETVVEMRRVRRAE